MKYLLILIVLIVGSTTAEAQKSYKKEIKQHRKAYKKEHKENARSPIDKKNLRYLRFYDANEAWRLDCRFTRTESAEAFDMATYSGQVRPYVLYGRAECPSPEGVLTLEIYQSIGLRRIPAYRDYLFLPFHDATNGAETYGGGRYLDLKIGDISGEAVTLDLNKVYNPYCAYADGFSCPIPPRPNHLTIAVPVGEKWSEHFRDGH